ncbi:MAG: hypothetical protein RL173_1993 [Fibrobacterota bacterium]
MTTHRTMDDAQRRLLRSMAIQVVVVAAIQFGLSLWEHRSHLELWQSVILALLAIPPLFSVGSVGRLSIGFLLPFSVYTLAAPWMLGGLRHPVTLLPIVAIHSIAFILGAPAAVWMVFASFANLLALAVCENQGFIPAWPPSVDSTFLYVGAFTLHALLFVSYPLDTIRQFLSQASSDLADRQANEIKLQAMTGSLEVAVASRRKELESRRAQLQRSADEMSAAMRSTILQMIELSRELTESIPEESREARWASFRIAAGCERMETMQVSLHRFCRMGEGSIQRRQLSPQAHTGMVHRIWDEVRNLQPDRPVSFFLDPIPGCTCDTELLRQVWQNLLSHAVRSASTAPGSPGVRVHFKDGDFCVEDNGTVQDQQSLSMFDETNRSSPPDGEESGEAIALAMARRIVEVHGGGMRAESGAGKGGVLRFHLPEVVG